MATIIMRSCGCQLKKSDGTCIHLKGNYELNIIDDDTLKDILANNPSFRVWVDKGYVVINSKNLDNVKADDSLALDKKKKERAKKRQEKAEAVVDEAIAEAVKEEIGG